MRSTFTNIEISKRSLFTQQAALQTTGHNIANANTRGFSRQVVHMVAARPIEAPGLMRSDVPGQMGQSVEFDAITRVREQFLDKQFYNESKGFGEWSVRRDTLEKLEAIINEPSETGIRKVLDGFWNAWQELSKQPDNLEARAVVKESALALTDAFNHAARQLKDLSADLTDNIDVKTSEVNSLLGQIKSLNHEIYRIETLGNNANDLRDQRDVLLDDLSKIINITSVEEEQGYTVRMGNVELVNGDTAVPFDLNMVNANYVVDGTGNLNSGELFGLMYSKNKLVVEYQNQLDSLVSTMANGINSVHKQGYTLKEPTELGQDFFVFVPQTTPPTSLSERMRVNTVITNNVENIAASKATYTDANGVLKVVRGNNELALQIAGIRNQKFNFDTSGIDKIILNGGTFDEFLRAVVGEIGVQTQEANRQANNQQILVEQIDARRQAVSGVSLDEEMANMIKFQHAYNAAARALTAADEVLDKIINGMGVVGR
ncbi:flagellar hook-associated protein FlgK [Paenibacillus contaminans]|uniref:Flagellar hook-associated protein 1 n=1 Tax=Paenibacillus contaminans TaxID=450362 RepID=A0A329MBD3_9BACL|nr:flagellar hook-associated protein FlgK [Paenibacillus contaminans]RAV17399.1 flagellar hook-associated protein FlgK [Paenibacillus contaminans]